MTERTPVLDIRNVTVGYGKQAVIHDINLTVGGGETFGLIGLNGAGKTTLIKSILALRDQWEGQILIDGHSNKTARSKALTAYLPERFNPPAFLSGNEFVRFSMKLYRQEFVAKTVDEAAEKLALDPAVLNSRVNTYSKGMRQKLGIMAAILTNCSILVLDEPMSGLDPMARVLVKELLGEVRKAGRTVFLSSHILSDMSEICDSVAVMHKGKILFHGSPQQMSGSLSEASLERAFLKLIEKSAA
jgi:ABC-2 type transport system ATP-binding protein